jgi:hypothetical protein
MDGAQQDAVWARTAAHNKVRSHLREYYPAFLAAFAESRGGIMRPDARAILAAAPTPAATAAHHRPAARPAAQGRAPPRHRHRSVTPTRSPPKPSAYTISVADGSRDTRRTRPG